MLEELKMHLKESQRPVGVKRPNHINLPSEDHIYGYKPKSDLEGADKGKKYIIKILIIFFNFSYKKLAKSRTIKGSNTT